MKKLSIIIPAYNAQPYLTHLLDCLKEQITEDVEIIVVDDGSKEPVTVYDFVKLIRQENGGASKARNAGLDNATGEYVAFIDADDLVADDYIETILSKIEKEKFDYCYMSWKSFGGWNTDVRLKSIDDKFPAYNLCVWNRIYKRSMIGKTRFNEKKLIAEDAEFIRAVNEDGKKKAFIPEIMYYYRTNVSDSLTKRFAKGEVDTNRVVYYYPDVTKDMTFLIDEFRETNKDSEVILLTNKNGIPELEKYAMVMAPTKIKGTELRGQKTSLFEKVYKPIRTQVVIYTKETFEIGGIETWIYNFCKQMHEFYDITVLYERIGSSQKYRLEKIVQVIKQEIKQSIVCDTLIVSRITDAIPSNVKAEKTIQMVHACKMLPEWHIPEDRDEIVCVSEVVKKSFGKETEKAKVINNMTVDAEIKNVLILVSATRLGTFEKGADRMIDLAKTLRSKRIPFVWIVFTDRQINGVPDGMVFMEPTTDIKSFIKRADYLVQLSDAEGFCYSIVEAMELGTSVITTPIPVLEEIGFIDGVHGYIVPFDINTEEFIEKVEEIPEFGFFYDNKKRVNQWKKLLGKSNPTHKYIPPSLVMTEVLVRYKDEAIGRVLNPGEKVEMLKERAEKVRQAGYISIEEE